MLNLEYLIWFACMAILCATGLFFPLIILVLVYAARS